MLFRALAALLAAATLPFLSACSADKAAGAEPAGSSEAAGGGKVSASGDASATGEAGAAGEAAPAAKPARPAKDPVLVRVRPVERGPIELRLEATANITSLDVVDVVSERAEPVLAVFVEEGQVVTAGQELARLRSDQVALSVKEAEVRVKESASRMQQTERDYLRNQRLWDEGASGQRLIAEQVLESSRQLWDAAKTAHESAQVALDRVRWEETRCVLRTPIAGTVTARDLSVGDMAVVGMRAFQITDLSHPKVQFYRPQRELSLIHDGQELTATSEALPGASIRGRIERVSPVVDSATGTVKIVAALDPEGRVIPSGILMRLVLVLERRESALLVPKEALLYEADGMAVFIARDGVARKVAIERGFEDAKHLEALAGSGIAEGDLLVVVGADRLADGDLVEIAGE